MLPPVAGSKRLDRALAGGAEGQKIFLFGIADNQLKSPDSRKEIPWNSFTLIWSGFPLAWIGFRLAWKNFRAHPQASWPAGQPPPKPTTRAGGRPERSLRRARRRAPSLPR